MRFGILSASSKSTLQLTKLFPESFFLARLLLSSREQSKNFTYMKKVLFSFVFAALAYTPSGHAQVVFNTTKFSQNFTSSTTLSSYINATTPNSGQWNAIGTSGAGTTVSVAANNLSFTRGAGNAGSFSRTTDFSPTPLALKYVFNLSISGNSVAQTTAAVWQIGSGYGTANSTESNANTYARIGLNLTTTAGQFTLRELGTSTNSSAFSGTQTITWILNNTGASYSYTAPDSTVQVLANDTADLWIGNTLAFDGYAVTTASQSMTDLKFAFTAGSATVTMDNFNISTIPEPHEYAFAITGLLGLTIYLRRRRNLLS
jgi:hypothetical protein